MSLVEARLAAMDITIPASNPPAGNYVRAHKAGDLLFLSGHLPDSDSVPRFIGKLGRDLTTEEGYQAARIATINSLGTIKQYLGDLDRVTHFVKLLGMVNSTPDYIEQPLVLNGSSDFLHEVFGPDIAPHARSAVGMASLPRGNSVEIEMIVQFK